MKFRGAIFDLDGTLLDSMPVWNKLGSEYLHAKGIEPRIILFLILQKQKRCC